MPIVYRSVTGLSACGCRVLSGAEAKCVIKELMDVNDDSSVLGDECHGLSLLNAEQYQSLQQCLMCWQRQYSSGKV